MLFIQGVTDKFFNIQPTCTKMLVEQYLRNNIGSKTFHLIVIKDFNFKVVPPIGASTFPQRRRL